MKSYQWMAAVALLCGCGDMRRADASRQPDSAVGSSSTQTVVSAANATREPQPEQGRVTRVALSSKRYWMRDRVWRDHVDLELLDSASTPSLRDSMTVRALYDSTVLVRYFCRYPEKPGAIVGAVAVNEDADVFSRTVAAWEIDTVRGRLVRLDSSRVSCDNSRYEP